MNRRKGRGRNKVIQGPLPPFLHQDHRERQREEQGNAGAPSFIPPPGIGGKEEGETR
jgi:hypothetical protein